MRRGDDVGEPTDWQGELRARGYRLTPQRQLVLEAVQDLEHATPDDILAHVRERASGVNMSTIYRTLELLEGIGLVTHTHLSHGAPTYHSAAVPQHVHLVCRSCKEVSELDPQVVEPLVTRLHDREGFDTDVAHLTIFGLCRKCAG
ncbi:MAG TPA: Fur family transcriptional regulator [Nocardioidaceae bacterium]|nr:Fur family transcriptional regulator [Nocardioidaceae bacterium]